MVKQYLADVSLIKKWREYEPIEAYYCFLHEKIVNKL